MDYGIVLASELDSWRWVQRAEELGFHSAWFYDTQLLNPDVFVCMALAADKTSRIRLGTGVLVPSNRIEPVAANALASLNKLAPGRIDFGVGTGFTARRTMGLPAIKLDTMRTYVERVQKLLRGEVIDWDFEGIQRKIGFLDPDLALINTQDDIPLWISAFGPKSRQLTASMNAGWLNFSAMRGAVESLELMQAAWQDSGRNVADLSSSLFFMGAVLSGNAERDNKKLMSQAGPMTSTIFHSLADDAGSLDGRAPTGPMAPLLEEYMAVHKNYEPADARYLHNHRGHLMYVRPEETHITPELVQNTTMSGTVDELVNNFRALKGAGYTQVNVQLAHGQESAIEEWAEVFHAI